MAVIEQPDFLRLPPDLASLFAAGSERSFFSRPAWYDVLLRHGLPPDVRCRIYAESNAALLCYADGAGEGREPRALHSLSSYYSCEHEILLAPGSDAASALRPLLAGLCRERPAWERIVLAALDPADPGFRGAAQAMRSAGLVVKPFFDAGTWYEDTAGLSFAEYLAQRPSALRNTWRRKSAKAERSGRLRWTFVEGRAGLEDGIAAYEAIYGSSWKKSEPFPLFMPALMRLAAGLGALRLGLVHVDGEPAAAQFWILWGGRACIYKLAHDQRFDDMSLGTLLTMRMTERILEIDKPAEINLGRGDDPYKKLWLPKRRERWGLVAANPRTRRGLVLAARHLAANALRRWRPEPARAGVEP